jgi:hypothetical protein
MIKNRTIYTKQKTNEEKKTEAYLVFVNDDG